MKPRLLFMFALSIAVIVASIGIPGYEKYFVPLLPVLTFFLGVVLGENVRRVR